MSASVPIDYVGLLTSTRLLNTANIGGTGTIAGDTTVDLYGYTGTCFVVLNNSAGATNTAILPKLYTSSDSNASNYNNYTTSSNFASFTNIGTTAGQQTVNVDLRAITASTNRYLGIHFVSSGAGAAASVDATFMGQKKSSS